MDLNTRAEIEKAWCRTGRAGDFATESEFDAALDEETQRLYPLQMAHAYELVRQMLAAFGNDTSMIYLVRECKGFWGRRNPYVLRKEVEGYDPMAQHEPFDFAFERTNHPPYEALASMRFNLDDKRVVNGLIQKYGPPPEAKDLEIVELVGRMWGHRGELFGSFSESFLVRERDAGLTLPTGPHDDLIPGLTLAANTMFEIEMDAMGLEKPVPTFEAVMRR